MNIRVLIADDHTVFRAGLRALLANEADIEVIAEVGTGAEAIEALDRHEVDVLILDISMPGLSGPRVAERSLQKHNALAIVVLTMHEDESYMREMFKVGVRAFVLKHSTATDLMQAIRAVYRGEQYIDPSMAGAVISSYVGRNPKNAKVEQIGLLTPREREICALLAYGHTNADIAKNLFISPRTVETHRTHIMKKLDLKSRAQLVRFAIENDLLSLD